MKVAYFDCFAGASGDMLLGALIDAGAELEEVNKQVSKLDLGRRVGTLVEIRVSSVDKAGIRATQVDVEGGEAPAFQTIGEGVDIIEKAFLEPKVAGHAVGVLRRLGEAEEKIHGSADVHLHELGTADTLVDVVGVAAALGSLAVDRVVSSALPTGGGTIQTGHGLMPVPSPAVIEILSARGDVPLATGPQVKAELLTPTGAAILAEYCESLGEIPSMVVEASGWGAGARDLPFANVLRVIVGSSSEPDVRQSTDLMIEANIDDMNPELYEYTLEKLFERGALDAWIVPAIGKRGRPVSILSVLAPSSAEAALRDIILAETSTIGLRVTPVRRSILEREWITVKVEGHAIRLKLAKRGGEVRNIAPEYADCVEAARKTGLPLKEVFRRASAAVGESGVEPA